MISLRSDFTLPCSGEKLRYSLQVTVMTLCLIKNTWGCTSGGETEKSKRRGRYQGVHQTCGFKSRRDRPSGKRFKHPHEAGVSPFLALMTWKIKLYSLHSRDVISICSQVVMPDEIGRRTFYETCADELESLKDVDHSNAACLSSYGKVWSAACWQKVVDCREKIVYTTHFWSIGAKQTAKLWNMSWKAKLLLLSGLMV